MGLFRRKKKRTLLIGLDGVPWSLFQQFIKDGVLKAAGEIVSRGKLQEITVSLPEISAVSWSNFMTGKNPGAHGIFGFVDLKPGEYELRFPSFKDLKAPTFWDTLGQHGKQSIIINQPSTYPARRIDGVLVAGFVAIDLDRAVFPRPWAAKLAQAGYMIDIDTAACRADHDRLFEELHRSLEGRRKAVELLWGEEWDFMEVVITGTDRLQHYLFPALVDAAHPRHQDCLDYYRAVDRFIGDVYARYCDLGGRDNPIEGFYLLSDHGFTSIEQEVYLNAWLRSNGYLDFPTDSPGGLGEMNAGSRAFALDPSRIYINRKGRYPKGAVRPEEAGPLADEIAKKLQELTYEGKPVVRQVFRRSEIYHGPEAPEGPDLVVLSHPGFDLKGSIKRREIFGRSEGLTGMHTWDDALFFSASGSGSRLNIQDLAPILVKSVL